MADSLGRDALDAQAITAAFAGNASATARELGVPCKVVIKAVLFVVAERDWLLSLLDAGVICRSQCERLAVLLDLLPPDLGLTPQAADVRKVAQTLPGPGHLQCGGCARACGFGESSSGGRPL